MVNCYRYCYQNRQLKSAVLHRKNKHRTKLNMLHNQYIHNNDIKLDKLDYLSYIFMNRSSA